MTGGLPMLLAGGVDPKDASPGIGAFITFLILAVVILLLAWSFTRHQRRIRANAAREAEEAAQAANAEQAQGAAKVEGAGQVEGAEGRGAQDDSTVAESAYGDSGVGDDSSPETAVAEPSPGHAQGSPAAERPDDDGGGRV